MPVIAALAHHRKSVAEPAQQIGGPGSERHHDGLGVNPAAASLNFPAAFGAGLERRRIAIDECSSAAREQIGIGGHQPAGLRNRPRIEPMDGARPGFGQSGLGRRELGPTDRARPHVVFGRERLDDRGRLLQRGLGPVQRAIAAAANQRICSRVPDQYAVLAGGLCDDGGVGPRDEPVPLRLGMPPVSEQRTKMLRQRCDAVGDIVGASCRNHRQRTKIARHRIGSCGLALNDAGVAVAGLAARLLAVDQGDRPASTLQMQRGRDPNHSGAENDDTSHD